jgi:hypothetical protein
MVCLVYTTRQYSYLIFILLTKVSVNEMVVLFLLFLCILLSLFQVAEFHSDNLYYQHHAHKYNQLDGYGVRKDHLCYSLLAESSKPIYDKENHMCWKIFDHDFYTPNHPRYQENYTPKFSISLNECRNAKTVLIFNQVLHPNIHSFSYLHKQFQETSSFHHTIPTGGELKRLYVHPPTEYNTTIGWLEFTLLDLTPHQIIVSEEGDEEEDQQVANDDKLDEITLCYHGETITYDSKLCTMEDMDRHIRKNRTHYFGGNGYYFTMKSENVVLWSPVTDHGEGIYTVRIRVDDPGDYTIKVYRENVKGCHMVDCDVPSEICLLQASYITPQEQEQCQHTNICMKEVTTVRVTVNESPAWPPWKHHHLNHHNKKQSSSQQQQQNAVKSSRKSGDFTIPLPPCPENEIGIQPGRWINPNVIVGDYRFAEEMIFGNPDWPFVWMPYDCYIPAFSSKEELHTCIRSKKLAFTGLSRERTNSFDIEDLLENPIVHKKVANAIQLGDKNYYFPVYYPQINDRSRWNQNNPFMNESVASVLYELRQRHLCTGGESHPNIPMAFLLNEEFIWASDTAYAKNWHEMSKDYQSQITQFCAHDDVTFVYKTTVAISTVTGSRAWERMFQATRQAAQLATMREIPVVDAFLLTIPWIHDRSIFPDGVHLYTNVMFQGNFVSKTATMMFLRYLCPAEHQ